MSAVMDKILKIYKNLSQTQTLVGAKLLQGGIINSFWSQRNIETGKNVKFLRVHMLDENLQKLADTAPFDISNELLISHSASEKYRAIIREVSNGKENRKQFLEIWTNSNLTQAVDLTALSIHGDVYADGEFKSFAWSPDETKLIYIAEKKLPKSEPFYKRKSDKSEEGNDETAPPTKGEEYLFRQDWGEQLVGKYSSVIVLYDLQTDSVKVLEGIPDDLCPGQVTWSQDGSYIVGIALETEPRKLGLIYCTNRPGFIFQLDLSGNFVKISEENRTVLSPRISPDGKYLIWLEKDPGGPHNGAMALMRTELPVKPDQKSSIVLDIVQTEMPTSNNKLFYGIFNGSTIIPERCWASDNRRIVLNSPNKCAIKTYVLNIETSKLAELKHDDSSQIALDISKDRVIIANKNYLRTDQCLIANLPNEGEEDLIKWHEVTALQNIVLLKENQVKYEFFDLKQNTDEAVKDFTAIYLGPSSGPDKEVPLLVWPHGGPHSAFANTFALEPSTLVSLGYAILFVNYRGSTGQGQATVDFLPSRIGDADVKDCILATKECCQKFAWINPNNMSLVGGSHGGFLVHHLSGQYPNMFRAVVSRNPVIDVASMSIVSDIPDWCCVEAGASYTQKGPVDNELFMKMRSVSPIIHAHKIKAATFLMLGSKDLRVPCSQGLELYYRLKANGTIVKICMYDDNHTLSSIQNEMDHIINGALWLLEHSA